MISILHLLAVFFIYGDCTLLPNPDNVPENQLVQWGQQMPFRKIATGQTGIPVKSLTASQTVGYPGPVLLQDSNLIASLAHFDRERIPERVVHAKGGGALGTFHVTHDITKFTKAKLFGGIGKTTPVLARFSTTMRESGSADTVHDGRGFGLKFYTEDGNWDIAGINFPVFALRDPILFPSFIRSRKRNPATHLKDPIAFWDFSSLRPETTFHSFFLFSALGIPDGFRFLNGYGVHAFKFVNHIGEPVYVKFHLVSKQGIRTLDHDTASRLGGDQPDYSIRDLYNAILNNDFPSWDLMIQIMTFKQAETYRWNPFDSTKLWTTQDFPLIPVGVLTLNKNPTDYFTQIEQASFSPGNLVPGIEPSPDRLLQGRLFSYPDSQRHRLGPNFLQLPVNRPFPGIEVKTYQKDGFMCIGDNGAGSPNYFPNSFHGPFVDARKANDTVYQVPSKDVFRIDIGGFDNYSQADWYWKTQMNSAARVELVENIANEIKDLPREVKERVLSQMYDPVNPEISSMLRSAVMKGIRVH